MSKERLRGIENRFRMTLKIFDLIDDDDLLTKDVLWLIEQNKRYREALKNIYELAEYDEYDNTLEQIVSEVEKSLEGEE